MTRNIILASLLAGTAAAAAPAARAPVVASPAGEPINCLRTTDIRDTRVRDDSTIDFYTRSGKIYRNALPHACPQLGFEQAFSYSLPTGNLCSVDLITVFRQTGGHLPGATCGLGQFQPVTIAR